MPPRTLRLATDAAGLLTTLATALLSLMAMFVAGRWERIMSAYFDQFIAATSWSWACVAYFISSLAVTALKPSSRFTSLRTTTACRGAAAVAGTAVMGYYSTLFPAVAECHEYRAHSGSDAGPAANCVLPVVAGAVGWTAVVVLVASLALEIAMLRRYADAWNAPLTALRPREKGEGASLNPRV